MGPQALAIRGRPGESFDRGLPLSDARVPPGCDRHWALLPFLHRWRTRGRTCPAKALVPGARRAALHRRLSRAELQGHGHDQGALPLALRPLAPQYQ